MKQWKAFKGQTLPQSALDWAEKFSSPDGFRSLWKYAYDGWCNAYYVGNDPKTATEWIIVTPDGGFYKVHAKYSLWYMNPKTGNPNMQCLWTKTSLGRSIKSLREGGDTIFDPKYTT